MDIVREMQVAYKNNIKISYSKQQNDLPKIKEQYPEYMWVYSKVLQSVLKRLDANYKSFFSLRNNGDETARPPKFRGEDYFFTMTYNQSGFEITDSKANTITCNSIDTTNYLYGADEPEYTEDDEIFVNFSHNHPSGIELKFGLPAKIVYDRLLSVAYGIAQIEIYQKKDGKYYLSITYNIPCLDFKNNDKYLAMDIGVSKHTMVDSDGNLREISIRDRINTVNLKSSRYNQGWITARDTVKMVQVEAQPEQDEQNLSNQLKDFQHKKTRNIVDNTEANVLLIGDLSAKQMASSKKGDNKSEKSTHRGTHNSGHIGRFVQFLAYKSLKIGKRIIEIDESYTSQDCYN